MSLPDVVSREEWLAARVKLLDEEKALTRHHDRVNAELYVHRLHRAGTARVLGKARGQ